MSGKTFLDTNVLIYLYSKDEPQKKEAAAKAIEACSGPVIISTQVINEFSNILIRKFGLDALDVLPAIEELAAAFDVVTFDLGTQREALRLKARYQFQYYDALIVATALENGCDTLLSEDMQHGQKVEKSLRIVSPFR